MLSVTYKPFMLSVIMLNVIMLSVVMLSYVALFQILTVAFLDNVHKQILSLLFSFNLKNLEIFLAINH